MRNTNKTKGIKNLSFSIEREDARIEKERYVRIERIAKCNQREQSRVNYIKLIGR